MFTRKLPTDLQGRTPSLQRWTDGGYDVEVAAQLLSMIAQAFRISESDAQRLRPDDSVWALYRHYYPRRSGWRGWLDTTRADELEIETLLSDMQRASPSVVIEDFGESASLGDLARLLKRSDHS